jgi:predicted acetyltransferase
MAATELGSIYLGGFRPVTLAAAGLVTGAAEKIRLCDRMFASDRAPWCEEIF